MDDKTAEQLQSEIEADQRKWKEFQREAEELVRSRGWTEKDEDFLYQIEEEARRLWGEDLDREIDRFFGY